MGCSKKFTLMKEKKFPDVVSLSLLLALPTQSTLPTNFDFLDDSRMICGRRFQSSGGFSGAVRVAHSTFEAGTLWNCVFLQRSCVS